MAVMAHGRNLVRKIRRLKLQLTDTADPATVRQILQTLKDLDITLDILAETGIGKTINCLRKHEQVGELAKELVRSWKQMVPKESRRADSTLSPSVSVKDKDKLDDQGCACSKSLALQKSNCVTRTDKMQRASNEDSMKTANRKAVSDKQHEQQQQRHKVEEMIDVEDNWSVSPSMLRKKEDIQCTEADSLIIDKKQKHNGKSRKSTCSDTLPTSDNFGTHQASQPTINTKTKRDLKEAPQPRLTKVSEEVKLPMSYERSDKDDEFVRMFNGSVSHNGKRKPGKEITLLEACKEEPGDATMSTCNFKKAKTACKDKDTQKPSMSFECCLNYDLSKMKREGQTGAKTHCKKIKYAKKRPVIHSEMKSVKLSVTPIHTLSPEKEIQESLLDLINTPLPTFLPECDKMARLDHARKNVMVSDLCDTAEESTVFTGQRLNKKMQVYSGTKTLYLPAMMTLHQQCIRTLQNNINMLYETGGVPFEIIEPVLERCTPEQLLRLEECNPIYIGVTDHLWGKHCQRDFRNTKLQEYESWKEMYIRLSEERERKFQRLTQSIISAHSRKPKGRQMKMAYIHTIAKPPRGVHIQQEIHGNASQPSYQLRYSVNVPENKPRSSCSEPTKSSNSITGTNGTQDSRKKTSVAPIMAKSLKAFRKQLGRR